MEQERITVDIAYDGETGLDLAQSEKYNVIIVDRMLPGIDGATICQKLRTQLIHTPILLLTALSQVSDKVAGLNIGADDYLTKPFEFEELLARVRALARRPAVTISNLLNIDDLSLNMVNFEVKRGETPVHLSHKEFTLLEFLMRHKNSIISKNQIIEEVWDFDSDILTNTVEVYIGYLRNKLDKAFPDKKPLIQTVRGFGYTISDQP